MSVHAPDRHSAGLRAIRLALGVTQADLAEQTGVHRSLVSRIERGLVPSWPRFRNAASASIGIPEAALFPDASAPLPVRRGSEEVGIAPQRHRRSVHRHAKGAR